MKKSPELASRIEEVRSLPQETPEDKEVKRFEAERLRVETMIDDAHCARALIEEVNSNPDIRIDELTERICGQYKISHPGVVQDFIATLIDKRDQTQKALEQHQDETGEPCAEALYYTLSGSQFNSQGPVRLVDSFRLAVTLEITNPKDYIALQGKTSLGVYYWNHDETFSPVILAKSKNKKQFEETLKHEIGHAENRVTMDLSYPHSLVWGRNINYFLTNKKIKDIRYKVKEGEMKSVSKETGEETNSPEFKQALDYCLSHAKDEVLAEWRASRNYINHLYNLQNNDSYAYEKHIAQNTDYQEKLREEYLGILVHQAYAAEELNKTYKKLGLESKVELLPWILARIPIEKWERQLKPFFNEVNEYEKIVDEHDAIAGSVVKGKKEADLVTEKIDMYDKFFKYVKTHNDQSLYEVVADFKKTLAAFDSMLGFNLGKDLEDTTEPLAA